MSRGFGATFGVGSTDAITTSLLSSGSDKCSYSVFVIRNGDGGGGRANVLSKGAGSNISESLRWTDVFTSFEYCRHNASNVATASHNMFGAFGEESTLLRPLNIVFTHDQSSGVLTPPNGFYNGYQILSTSVAGSQANAASNNTDPYIIGNGPAGSTNWDGCIAHIAKWDGIILGWAEALALSLGAHPMSIAPGNLVLYMPLDGIHNPEINLVVGAGDSSAITGTRFGTRQPSSAPLYIPTQDDKDEYELMEAAAAASNTNPMVSWIY